MSDSRRTGGGKRLTQNFGMKERGSARRDGSGLEIDLPVDGFSSSVRLEALVFSGRAAEVNFLPGVPRRALLRWQSDEAAGLGPGATLTHLLPPKRPLTPCSLERQEFRALAPGLEVSARGLRARNHAI